MQTLSTEGVVLKRINYGEADRIVTYLTPDHGKVRVMARGVRKERSKLAGGIEPLSVNSISYIRGKGDIGTLISSRMEKHFPSLVSSLKKTTVAYEMIGLIDSVADDNAESSYFELLVMGLSGLALDRHDGRLIEAWFLAQMLQLNGHQPDLNTDVDDDALEAGGGYEFDFSLGKFRARPDGLFEAEKIKLLRLFFMLKPEKLLALSGIDKYLDDDLNLLRGLSKYYLDNRRAK